MTSNNTLQRSCDHRGRLVLAMDGVLAEAEQVLCPAAERDR